MLKTLPRMAAERLVWVLVVAGVACSSRITPPVDSNRPVIPALTQFRHGRTLPARRCPPCSI